MIISCIASRRTHGFVSFALGHIDSGGVLGCSDTAFTGRCPCLDLYGPPISRGSVPYDLNYSCTAPCPFLTFWSSRMVDLRTYSVSSTRFPQKNSDYHQRFLLQAHKLACILLMVIYGDGSFCFLLDTRYQLCPVVSASRQAHLSPVRYSRREGILE